MDEHIDEKIELLANLKSKLEDVESKIIADKSNLQSGDLYKNIKAGDEAVDNITKTIDQLGNIKSLIANFNDYLNFQKKLDWKE